MTKVIDLIATYEELKNVPEEDRLTAYFGDYGMHHLVNDVDMEKVREVRDEALKVMGMTLKEFTLTDAFVYRQNIKQYMSERMAAQENEKRFVTDKKFDLLMLFEKPVLFTCERVNRAMQIGGLCFYDIRHDDDCSGEMVELKDFVLVNHWGTVLAKEKFEPRECDGILCSTKDGISISPEDYNYTGEEMSIQEYHNRYDELVREYSDQGMGSIDEMNM